MWLSSLQWEKNVPLWDVPWPECDAHLYRCSKGQWFCSRFLESLVLRYLVFMVVRTERYTPGAGSDSDSPGNLGWWDAKFAGNAAYWQWGSVINKQSSREKNSRSASGCRFEIQHCLSSHCLSSDLSSQNCLRFRLDELRSGTSRSSSRTEYTALCRRAWQLYGEYAASQNMPVTFSVTNQSLFLFIVNMQVKYGAAILTSYVPAYMLIKLQV